MFFNSITFNINVIKQHADLFRILISYRLWLQLNCVFKVKAIRHFCKPFLVSLCRGFWDILPQCEEGPRSVLADLLRLSKDLAAEHEECREDHSPDHQLPQWLLQAHLWTYLGVRKAHTGTLNAACGIYLITGQKVMFLFNGMKKV